MVFLKQIKTYLELSKPRVVLLMIFTSFIGMLLAEPIHLNYEIIFLGNLGIAFMAFSAGSLNQLLDHKIDSVMDRTKGRPLPLGLLSPNQVIIYSFVIGLLGFLILFIFVNNLTAWLTFLSLVGYAFIYTLYLKRRTSQNIVIGGAAGATPPLLGWTSITGSIDTIAIILFMIIFVWTPPHFWSLALHRKKEYSLAKIPMLPNTHGEQYTRMHITFYTFILTIVSFLPFLINFCSIFYLVGSLILNIIFLYLVPRMQLEKNNNLANKIFNYSIIYLSALFGFLISDRYLLIMIS